MRPAYEVKCFEIASTQENSAVETSCTPPQSIANRSIRLTGTGFGRAISAANDSAFQLFYVQLYSYKVGEQVTVKNASASLPSSPPAQMPLMSEEQVLRQVDKLSERTLELFADIFSDLAVQFNSTVADVAQTEASRMAELGRLDAPQIALDTFVYMISYRMSIVVDSFIHSFTNFDFSSILYKIHLS